MIHDCQFKPELQINQSEIELVKRLIELYDAAYDNSHSRVCECSLCEALDAAGEIEFQVFSSLSAKVGAR